MGTVTDITERKQTELELRRLQAQLEVQATIDSLTQVSNRYQLDIFFRPGVATVPAFHIDPCHSHDRCGPLQSL